MHSPYDNAPHGMLVAQCPIAVLALLVDGVEHLAIAAHILLRLEGNHLGMGRLQDGVKVGRGDVITGFCALAALHRKPVHR